MDLNALRSDIDSIDEEIVRTLARRFEICRTVAACKAQTDTPMMQPARVRQVKERCASLGAAYGLDPEFVERLYDLIIEETCALEEYLIRDASRARA